VIGTGLYVEDRLDDKIYNRREQKIRDGLHIVTEAVEEHSGQRIGIVRKSFGTHIETAVECIKKGAFDFIEKPIDLNRLLITVRNALDKNNLVTETKILKKKVAKRHQMIGQSEAIEKVRMMIETGEGDYKEEILELNKLAQILRKQRLAAGAIDFDRVEVKFEIDETGKPLSVYFKESKEANKLIEEFMLLANRTVAEKIGKVPKNKKAKVFPYRIHDLPDPDKLENLNWFINRFGYKIRTSGSKTEISKSINRLLDDIKNKKEQNLVETVSLRAMQKARYSTHNIGHYGLAFDYYTHFTSPIRRFPDMMVHRLLTRYLAGGRTVQEAKYEELCDHSSEMEQIAANAERASVKYKQVEFMGERLGMEFDGVISGVTEWGLYVELNENKCEGMIPMRDLGDDYYDFDEKNYCLTGRRHHKKFSLGDPVTIKVARANLEKKQLDFALVEK
jgi:ribonuclease R